MQSSGAQPGIFEHTGCGEPHGEVGPGVLPTAMLNVMLLLSIFDSSSQCHGLACSM